MLRPNLSGVTQNELLDDDTATHTGVARGCTPAAREKFVGVIYRVKLYKCTLQAEEEVNFWANFYAGEG